MHASDSSSSDDADDDDDELSSENLERTELADEEKDELEDGVERNGEVVVEGKLNVFIRSAWAISIDRLERCAEGGGALVDGEISIGAGTGLGGAADC